MALSRRDFRNMTDEQLAEWDLMKRKAEQHDAQASAGDAELLTVKQQLEAITRERDELRQRCASVVESHVEVQYSAATGDQERKDQLAHLVDMYDGLVDMLMGSSELRILVQGIPRVRAAINAGKQVTAITRAMIQ